MPGHPGPAFGRPECKLVPGIHVFHSPISAYSAACAAGVASMKPPDCRFHSAA